MTSWVSITAGLSLSVSVAIFLTIGLIIQRLKPATRKVAHYRIVRSHTALIKPAFSSLDHVSLAPAAEFWAVRSGPAGSLALVGLQVSAPDRASADRCAVGCDVLGPTFYFSVAGLYWLTPAESLQY
jgi:hypothetical protein